MVGDCVLVGLDRRHQNGVSSPSKGVAAEDRSNNASELNVNDTVQDDVDGEVQQQEAVGNDNGVLEHEVA